METPEGGEGGPSSLLGEIELKRSASNSLSVMTEPAGFEGGTESGLVNCCFWQVGTFNASAFSLLALIGA